MEKVNLFTVRRTEAAPEREIVWERDFPAVLNKEADSVSLVRDRQCRQPLTGREKYIIRTERRRRIQAEADAAFVGIAVGAGLTSLVFNLLLKVVGA